MSTPLEAQIASDFEELLESNAAIPPQLAADIHALITGDGSATALAVLETITSAVGDQNV